MKFGVFYELALPKPWHEDSEYQLIHQAMDQIVHADKLGFDYAWEVEHHFLEEYSHSSAPETFLAAASQRTSNIRLAQGAALLPAPYNHPIRVAERVATLDLLSNGRVDLGTAESASRAELEAFGIDPSEKREMWEESLRVIADLLAMDPFPGFQGEHLQIPMRNLVPKPRQKPHPPMWLACSSLDSIRRAARLGLGALSFTFLDPAQAKVWVDEYYRILKEECVPIAHAVNPNILLVSGFGVHRDPEVAVERFLDGIRFFQFSGNHHYRDGWHRPGRSDIWSDYMAKRDEIREGDKSVNLATEEEVRMSDRRLVEASRGAIGSVEQVRARIQSFVDIGIDQLVFVQQAGKNNHDHILESMDLFQRELMHEFRDGEEKRQEKKLRELEPYIEQAFRRKNDQRPLRMPDDQVVGYSPQQASTGGNYGKFHLPGARRVAI